MFGTQSKRDLALELQAQFPILRPSIHARRANLTVKFQDLYGFTVEGNVDDVNVLNEVREKVRQQGRVWWALEASKGANWYLQPQVSSLSEGIVLKSSLKLAALANSITLKRLIRKGIPPVLRPKVWFSLSGAAKKKSTVPESYYNDLTKAVDGKVTPATRQIDHDLPRTFPGHPWLDTPEGHAALRRVLVGYSFRDSDVGYCQMKEDELLLTHQVGDIINILQRTTHHLFDPDELLTVAFDKIGFMTTNTISKQRKKQEPEVMKELDERLRRLNSLRTDDK
uniref:Rab-GAP TBC domain-containing protein n=1 Tax=Gossypium raimondii TaxID=29730 RepID=A0A0D2QTZ7_GOSRA|nr:hypothetical protein B456_001G218800 [Gossypium raimondii]